MAGKEQQITEEKPLLPEKTGVDSETVSFRSFSALLSLQTAVTFELTIKVLQGPQMTNAVFMSQGNKGIIFSENAAQKDKSSC